MKTTCEVVVMLALALSLTGCPNTGVVCKTGTSACGLGCADLSSDRRNCGACGNACGTTLQCSSGACVCPSGTQVCGGDCVVIAQDNKNCGACGRACAENQVCEASTCRGACSLGLSNCSGACVDPQTSTQHCGQCAMPCQQGQFCRAGSCVFETIAACFTSGHVVGLSSNGQGTLSDVGNGPQALAKIDGVLLSADGLDNRLYQGVVQGNGFAEAKLSSKLGASANQILVNGDFVYVVNAISGTLQVLKKGADAGVVVGTTGVNGGLLLGTVGEVSFGMNSFPEGLALLGNELFVPLWGGIGVGPAEAGQTLVRLSLANPALPSEISRINLKALDLKPFDGGTTVPRPFAVTVHQGAVYAVLNNLNPVSSVAEGPGILAKYIPEDAGLTAIVLDSTQCLNPVWAKSVGTSLVVSCAGKAEYGNSGEVTALEKSGLVVLNANDAPLTSWSSGCADGGRCDAFFPGRFSVRGNRISLGDQNAGRIVVLDLLDGGLSEVRGLNNPIAACPKNDAGLANVSDVLAP
jgi:Stigma-specific protein, Stig1